MNNHTEELADARHLPPLPKKLTKRVHELMPGDLASSANAGLVFWRYPRVWGPNFQPLDSEHRSVFLQEFTRLYPGQKKEQEPLLKDLRGRLDSLGPHRDYTPTGPLVTGLGADHPLENGFTFHPLLGVPWLPGSSVKGLVRAAARLLGEEDGEIALKLLGPGPEERPKGSSDSDSSAQASQGRVAFLGALPKQWPQLMIDIVNPHHPTYYADQVNDPANRKQIASPVESPRPVTFLVVSAETQFRFWLRPLGPKKEKVDLEPVWRWLSLGLDLLGIGSKTAAGYGHMR